jgi:predicted porin
MNVKGYITKRSAIAAAVASVLAAAPVALVHADVSIYGVADVAVSSLDVDQAGSKLFLTSGSGSGGSRLGFNASADMGGGLTAKANYEAGVNMDAAGGADGDVMFGQRQAWVGLAGGFGSITAGQDYTLSFLAAYRGEYCGWCGIASPAMLTMQGVRSSNYLKYNSPDMGGFSFGVAHVFGEDAASGDDIGDANEVAVFYSAGPVNIAASTRNTTLAADNDLTDTYLAGNVAFGMVKVYALVGAAETDDATVEETYTNLGVTLKVGGGDLNFQYALTDGDAADSSTTLTAASFFYPLAPKGATVYVQLAKVDNDDNAQRSSWPGNGGNFTPAVGGEATGFQLGVKYGF